MAGTLSNHQLGSFNSSHPKKERHGRKEHLVTDIRYNLGLLPLTNEQSPNGFIKNHGILFSAGYLLRLSR